MQSQANLTAALMKLGMENPELMEIIGDAMRQAEQP